MNGLWGDLKILVAEFVYPSRSRFDPGRAHVVGRCAFFGQRLHVELGPACRIEQHVWLATHHFPALAVLLDDLLAPLGERDEGYDPHRFSPVSAYIAYNYGTIFFRQKTG